MWNLRNINRYVKTKISLDFQICISVPLSRPENSSKVFTFFAEEKKKLFETTSAHMK